jgi:hypothetical protein
MHVPEADVMVPHTIFVFWAYSNMVVLPFGFKKLHNKLSVYFTICDFLPNSEPFSFILLPYVIRVISIFIRNGMGIPEEIEQRV